MSGDKMREEHWRQWGIAGMPKDKIRLAEETWKAATEACAAIKDAEIAARDLMIKEWVSIVDRLLTTKPGAEFDLAIFDAKQLLAKSEHHNSRALEKILLEAEIKGLNRGAELCELHSDASACECPDTADYCRILIQRESKAKLAELNKE